MSNRTPTKRFTRIIVIHAVSIFSLWSVFLCAVAAITMDAFHFNTRIFLIISAATLLALLITIWLLYRRLSSNTVIPLIQTAKRMKSGMLRTQIDAHFVVNTIDCVEKLIQQKKYAEAEIAAHNLTALTTSMHAFGDEVPVDDELDALIRYIEIMNIRSGDKYYVDIDVDDELSDYRMPARILQPLVENAIHHGFAGMTQGCELKIEGRLEKQGVVFWWRTTARAWKRLERMLCRNCSTPPTNGTMASSSSRAWL